MLGKEGKVDESTIDMGLLTHVGVYLRLCGSNLMPS